jgi:hypothetical protein
VDRRQRAAGTTGDAGAPDGASRTLKAAPSPGALAAWTVPPIRLTLAEGTRRATYKTVTVTVPGDARVRDNRTKAALSTLKAGQRVLVVQGGPHVRVVAHDAR